MSLVSNFIGEISPSLFGISQKVSNSIDMNDKTFEDILEKQLNTGIKKAEGIDLSTLGAPAGLSIENIDLSETYFTENKKTESVNTDLTPKDIKDITTSEAATFFTSLLEKSSNIDNNNEIFDFAKKQATKLYNKYSRNVITDMSEFVEDLKGMM